MIHGSRAQPLALVLVAFLFAAACGGDDDTDGAFGGATAGGGVPTVGQSDPTAAQPEPTAAASFEVTSTGFDNGQPIPVRFTCDGDDVSPLLAWGIAPPGTVSIAILLLDPDAPGGTFVHWVVANIPAESTGLPEGWDPASSADVVLGRTGFGREGYGGPCPPRGSAHKYEFRVFALDAVIDFEAGGSASALSDAMDGHILAESLLVGIYSR